MSTSKQKINFGTDGWRGIIAEDFTYENLGRVAVKVSGLVKSENKKISIGYDNRFLSPEFAEFFAEVLEKQGIETDLSDSPVSTPIVSHRVKKTGSALGVAITASHNPAQYSGVKIKESYGGSARAEVVNSIVNSLSEAEYNGQTYGLEYRGKKNNWKKDYKEDIMKVLPKGNLNIVCDFMYGTAYPYFKEIISEKGYNIKTLRGGRDPLFGGIHPEPRPEALNYLAEGLKKENADIGFAFDGDGDRIAVLDEKGDYLSAQIILSMLAYDLLNRGKKGKIIKTVAGTYLIDRMKKDYEFETKMVPIGFKNICPEMINNGVIIAGEESGGIGFGDYLPERDAIYTACRIIEMIIRRGKTISEIWKEVKEKYGNSVYLREDFKIDSKLSRQKIINKVKKEIKDKIGSFNIKRINDMDGVRITLDRDRWLLVRPSGTEPLVRIYAESENEDISRNLIKKGRELVE